MWIFACFFDKDMDLFSKIHVFESMKSHLYEPNSLIRLMFSYVKPRMKETDILNSLIYLLQWRHYCYYYREC